MKIPKFFAPLLLLATALLLGACSDNNDDKAKTGDHVWKTQTDALQQSKDVAKELQKNFDLQKQQMEDSE